MTEDKIETIDVEHRALIFGGAYGNFQATNAILNYAKLHGFGPANTIFTGDLVAYCGQPQETTDLIREFNCHMIMGNCEESLAAGRDDCGCGFEENTACSVLSAQWFSFCQSALNHETKQWMGTLPRSLDIQIGGFRLFCTHGTPSEINEFVFPSDIAEGRFHVPSSPIFDGYVVGHSGLPFIAEQNNKIWLNSGSGGMPANDGTPNVWFATVEAANGILTAELHAVDYDAQSAATAMRSAGLDNGYRDCLSSGIWPSHDVLPETERNLMGRKIRPQKKALRKAPLSALA